MYHVNMRGNSVQSGYKRKQVKRKETALKHHINHIGFNGLVAGTYNFGGYFAEKVEETNKTELLHLYYQQHRHNDELENFSYFLLVADLYSTGQYFEEAAQSNAARQLNYYFQEEMKKLANWDDVTEALVHYGIDLIGRVKEDCTYIGEEYRKRNTPDREVVDCSKQLERVKAEARKPFVFGDYTMYFTNDISFVRFVIEKKGWNETK